MLHGLPVCCFYPEVILVPRGERTWCLELILTLNQIEFGVLSLRPLVTFHAIGLGYYKGARLLFGMVSLNQFLGALNVQIKIPLLIWECSPFLWTLFHLLGGMIALIRLPIEGTTLLSKDKTFLDTAVSIARIELMATSSVWAPLAELGALVDGLLRWLLLLSRISFEDVFLCFFVFLSVFYWGLDKYVFAL